MNKVQRVYDITAKLIEFLETSAETDRDEKIKLIEDVLEEREHFIQQLAGPYTDEENELGSQLVDLNEKLAILLNKVKQDIQKDIKELNRKKQSNQKYVNPYQNLSTDGMFYDKKN